MLAGVILEACVEDFEQAILAEKRGADRIELCANLKDDGLTPTECLIKKVVENLTIPVRIIIRPEAGNFMCSEAEFEEMKSSVELVKDIGAEGVVLGILDAGGQMDIKRIDELVSLSRPLNVTIHKVIDCTDDPVLEMKKLERIEGIDTILTSGKAETAAEGIDMLIKLRKAAERLVIMACGKITDQNLNELHKLIGTTAYHGKKIVGELEKR